MISSKVVFLGGDVRRWSSEGRWQSALVGPRVNAGDPLCLLVHKPRAILDVEARNVLQRGFQSEHASRVRLGHAQVCRANVMTTLRALNERQVSTGLSETSTDCFGSKAVVSKPPTCETINE